MRSFGDKVAAITGAGSGIGRELAVQLAGQGCHLALSDIDSKGLAETATLASPTGVRITTARVDVADRTAMYAWADQVAKDHGKVNLVFNNAGVALGATVEGVSFDDFDWLMGINFWGVVHGTKAFLPHLKAAGEGHVVNLSSVFGLAAIPSQAVYNASKFAVRGFTESLRQELDMQKSPVSATSIHPGGIRTNIARSARISDSIGQLGFDQAQSRSRFENNFRTTAAQAAHVILRAVQKNKRRALIGADAYLVDWMVRLLPALYQRLTMWFARLQM